MLQLQPNRTHFILAVENAVKRIVKIRLALLAEHELRKFLAGNRKRDPVLVTRILGHRHQPVLPIKYRERVWYRVDQRPLPRFGLRHGDCARRNRL